MTLHATQALTNTCHTALLCPADHRFWVCAGDRQVSKGRQEVRWKQAAAGLLRFWHQPHQHTLHALHSHTVAVARGSSIC